MPPGRTGLLEITSEPTAPQTGSQMLWRMLESQVLAVHNESIITAFPLYRSNRQ